MGFESAGQRGGEGGGGESIESLWKRVWWDRGYTREEKSVLGMYDRCI